MNNKEKILLILDIDETLIHARNAALDRASDFMVFDYHVYKRPFLDEFLKNAQQHFRIAFWSSASEDYIEKILEIIYPEPNAREFVWGRKRCTPKINDEFDEYSRTSYDGFAHYNYIKRIQKIKKFGYSLEKTIIVDDTPGKINNSYGNAIYINEYNGDLGDTELEKLFNYLLTLKDQPNIRQVEKRGWHKSGEK